MSSPQLAGTQDVMSFKPVIFWASAGLLGLIALTMLVEPEAPVMTLEGGLGETVVTTRL